MRHINCFGPLIALAGLLSVGTLSPAHAQTTGSFDRTLQVSTSAVNLDVTSGSGEVVVHAGPAGSVHVVGKIRAHAWGNEFVDEIIGEIEDLFSSSPTSGETDAERIQKLETNPPIVQQGNSIRVGEIGDPDLRRDISIDYDVTVPALTALISYTGSGDQSIAGLQLPATVKSGSGAIAIANIGGGVYASAGSGSLRIDSVKGALDARTGSGTIRATGIAGAVSATAGSGSIEIQQVAAGGANVRTGSGDVTLHGVQGALLAQTGSGGIHVDGTPAGDWHLSAGSGDIALKVPADASFDVDARTGSGSLRVDRPVTMQGQFSRNRVQGKVGKGGALLEAHTGSGSIEID